MCCSSIHCRCSFFQHKPQRKMADALSHPWWESANSSQNPLWQGFHTVHRAPVFGACTCGITVPSVYLTVEQLKDIAKRATLGNIIKHVDHLNSAMHKYHTKTPIRIAHFIAQVAHESGYFAYTREIADGSNCEGRVDLGNTQKGDGKRF